MSIVPSNMTNREIADRYGVAAFSMLCPERMDDLIDRVDVLDAATVSGIISVDEAIAQYPKEDFLSDIKDRIVKIADRSRGQNKENLEALLEALNDLEMVTYYAAEAGIEHLRKLKKTLDDAGVGA